MEYLNAITARACEGAGCTREEARAFASEDCALGDLMDAATRVRRARCGDAAEFCAIVNARSGACSEDCRFCAQSARFRTNADTYPLLDADAIADAARRMAGEEGVRGFGIVTSGPTVKPEELDGICRAVETIRRETELLPCASLGGLDAEALRALKDAGLTRYHHNLETSRGFFPKICTTHDWQSRVETVRAAHDAGLEVCSGGLFGLGESWDDRIDLGLTLRELGVRSVPLNFLNPVPGTPLAGQARLSTEEGLRILAMFRMLLPDAMIRACGGRPQVLGDRQADLFRAGANALMTGDYLTTAGVSPAEDRRMTKAAGMRLPRP